MRLIAVFGAAPGIGKSSLCSALAQSLASDGLSVEHFPEERLFSRPEFAAIAAEFTDHGTVTPSELVDATVRYLDHVDADVVVMDALIPYVPTLLALGYDQPSIDRIIDELAGRIAAIPTLFVFLDGDPAAALTRAIAREQPGWIDAYGAKLARYGLTPADPDLGAMCAYLQRERDEMLRTVRRQSWDLCLIPDAMSLTAGEILQLVEGSWKVSAVEHPRISISGRVWLPFGQDPAKTQP